MLQNTALRITGVSLNGNIYTVSSVKKVVVA